jgi:hypothetical protein
VIRRLDDALRSDLAAAPVDRRLALFEAATMSRCATAPSERPGRGRGTDPPRGPARRTPGVLVELSSRAAAQRYRVALCGLTTDVEVRDRQLGWRHAYEVHQVLVPVREEPRILNRLARAWQSGVTLLTATGPAASESRQAAAATAAWRSVLLVGGPGRGAGCLRVRLADASAADLLARAAVILGVPVRTVRRPGGYLVIVDDPVAVARLLAGVSAGLPETPAAALVPAV